jgi:sec-independent protein translocase protein TatA
MGFRGVSFGSLILILLIVIVLFGTKRLREMGSDLGAAVRNFKKAMHEEEIEQPKEKATSENDAH